MMSQGNQPKGRARFPDLTLGDLLAELIWPGLLKAGSLSLRPQRLLLAACTIVGVGLVGSLSRFWSPTSFGMRAGQIFRAAMDGLGRTIESVDLSRVWELPLVKLWVAIQALLLDAPAQLIKEFPVSAVVLGIPMVIITLGGWFAIARSAAFEFGLHVPEPWTACVARAVQRLWSVLVGVFVMPLAGAVVLSVIAGVGWMLMGFPVLNVLAAALWGLALVLCVVTALLAALWAVGLPMLAPAIACEGPDAFDALQRSLAYVLGKPLRYLIYVGILIALGVLLGTVIELVLHAGLELAIRSVSLLLDPAQAAIVTPSKGDPPLNGTAAAAAEVFEFWREMLGLVMGAYALSYFGTASSVLYLSMRKVNDGQDVGDLSSEIMRR